jgi:hypothetical protein
MSLIDEALKRAEMEAARRDGLRGGAYPWVPEHSLRKRRRWAVIAAVVVVAGIVAGGVLWLSRRPVPAPAPGPGSKVQSSPPNEELQTVVVAPPPRGQPDRIPAADQDTTNPKASGEVKRPAPKPPAEPAHARIATDAVPPPAAAATDGKAARGPADAKTYVGELTAPDGAKIELGGIVYSETNPVALINGKVLGPGATVEEFTIVSIQPDRVELRGRGITMFIALK